MLPEMDYRMIMREWSTFCGNVSHTLSPLEMKEKWAKFSSFLPLSACSPLSTTLASNETGSLLGVTITQLVLVIFAIILFMIRKFALQKYAVTTNTSDVRDAGNDIYRGTQL